MATSILQPLLKPLALGGGEVQTTGNATMLKIPAGPKGRYRLAQLDDYGGLRRGAFPWRAPIRLSLRARVSRGVTSGTWGFGFWNDPFGMALNPFRRRLLLPAPPQSAWYFWASPASYLSFRADLPAKGFLAQVFRSAPGRGWLASVGLSLAVSRAAARAALRRHVDEDSCSLAVDAGSWHVYEIQWESDTVQYRIDGQDVFRSRLIPRSPLGLVIWIDNQFAAFDPTGRLAWGCESTERESTLEIADLELSSDG